MADITLEIVKHTKYLGSGLGAHRPRGPPAFVQPCPMGVTPVSPDVVTPLQRSLAINVYATVGVK